jgi:hypothetical protein
VPQTVETEVNIWAAIWKKTACGEGVLTTHHPFFFLTLQMRHVT